MFNFIYAEERFLLFFLGFNSRGYVFYTETATYYLGFYYL